jgi:ABC-type Na+ efflux pump permease subunit
MGLMLVLMAPLVAGIRCAGSITEEKRRKTWEDLVMTPLSVASIAASKRAGVLQSTRRYLVAYAVPMFALAALGGDPAVIIAIIWLFVTCLLVLGAAFMGTGIAASTEREPFEWPAGRMRTRMEGWGAMD